MSAFATPIQWILGTLLIFSSLGIVLLKKPVHAALSFLITLLTLSVIYLQLSAQFIAVMQILVYAGAILVIFMFVIILFQDAHKQLSQYQPNSSPILLIGAAGIFIVTLVFLGKRLINLPNIERSLPVDYGTVQSLGKALYIDFFFPFEAVTLLFLIAVVGALYIAKRIE